MVKLAILTGGKSKEWPIALLSSQFVKAQADRFFKTEIFDFPKDMFRFIKKCRQYDLAIPVFHGRGGEDGEIQGFLQALNIPYFLEVNTIPGLTRNSLVPKAIKAAGLDFGLLLKSWVESELNKHAR